MKTDHAGITDDTFLPKAIWNGGWSVNECIGPVSNKPQDMPVEMSLEQYRAALLAWNDINCCNDPWVSYSVPCPTYNLVAGALSMTMMFRSKHMYPPPSSTVSPYYMATTPAVFTADPSNTFVHFIRKTTEQEANTFNTNLYGVMHARSTLSLSPVSFNQSLDNHGYDSRGVQRTVRRFLCAAAKVLELSFISQSCGIIRS